MAKKPKVSVEVEQETYDRYREQAARAGLPLSAWVRRALDAASPVYENTGERAAFEVLDRVDSGSLRPFYSARRILPLSDPDAPPPTPATAPQPGDPGHGPPPTVATQATPGHPCRWHTRAAGPRLDATCGNPQRGGPCHWPAPVAHNCASFTKLRVKNG